MAKVYQNQLIFHERNQKYTHLLMRDLAEIDQILKYAITYRVKITLKYYYRKALLNITSHFVGVHQKDGEILITEASGYTIPLKNIVQADVVK